MHLDSLTTKTDLRKFKIGLQSLPEGLDDTYDEVMSRILAQHPDYVALARKVIYWVFYAVRPLTLKEVQHALAVEPNDTSLDEDSIVDEDLLVSVCTGIITVQHESGVVGLVHYTAQQYLERKAQKYFPDAQHEIVRTCLTYLSFKEFDKGPCRGEKKLEARLKSWPLLRYAAQHWADHASSSKPPYQVANLFDRLTVKSCSRPADGSATHQDLRLPDRQLDICLREKSFKRSNFKGKKLVESGTSELPDSQVGKSPSETLNAEVLNLDLILKFLHQDAKVASFVEVAALRRDLRTPRAVTYIRNFPPNPCALSVCAFLDLEITACNLLCRGANESTKDGHGRTPLHYAVLHGHEEMTRLLLENRADVTAKDMWDSVPLHLAALLGHEALCQMLLGNGADVAAEDIHGFTPLHQVVTLGRYAITQTLLDYGADVNAESRLKETPLHIAIETSSEAVTLLLLHMGADVNAKDSRGKTPLHMTIMDGNLLPTLLLEHGADLGIKDNDGITVLHLAVRYGRLSLASLLLASGADTEEVDNHGRAPLHLAAQSGHEELVEFLIKGGASVASRDGQGMTALHHAAAFEHLGVMKLLLDYGASIDSRDRGGRSVIDVTTYMCNKPATQLLLRNGADITDHNSDWGSILNAAAQKGDEEMVLLLVEFGADINASGGLKLQGRNALHLACSADSLGCVEVLLNYGADLWSLDGQKRTCLHHAAASGSAEIITRLLKEGLDPRAGDIDGWTALDWAARAGRLTSFKILSEAVAEAINLWKTRNIAVYHGQIALASYVETVSKNSLDRVECLPDGSHRCRSVLNECHQIESFPTANVDTESVPNYTELTNLLDSQHQAMPAPQHLGVWCDGCYLPICGPCYKCSICADFDYCFKCITSSQDNHPSHDFILMAVEGVTAFNVQLSLSLLLKHKMRMTPPLDWLKLGPRPKIERLLLPDEVD